MADLSLLTMREIMTLLKERLEKKMAAETTEGLVVEEVVDLPILAEGTTLVTSQQAEAQKETQTEAEEEVKAEPLEDQVSVFTTDISTLGDNISVETVPAGPIHNQFYNLQKLDGGSSEFKVKLEDNHETLLAAADFAPNSHAPHPSKGLTGGKDAYFIASASLNIDPSSDASAESSKHRILRQLKMVMEENRFMYIPPRVKLKYLHYEREGDDGSLVYVAHTYNYKLLRDCARVDAEGIPTPLPPEKVEEQSFNVLGLNQNQRSAFVQLILTFGVGEYDWVEFVPRMKQKTLEENNKYALTFLHHTSEDQIDSPKLLDCLDSGVFSSAMREEILAEGDFEGFGNLKFAASVPVPDSSSQSNGYWSSFIGFNGTRIASNYEENVGVYTDHAAVQPQVAILAELVKPKWAKTPGAIPYIWPIGADKYVQPHQSLVSDAHKAGLEVYASNFAIDLLKSYNFSHDPIQETIAYIDNGEFSVDGLLTDFTVTQSEAIHCCAHIVKNDAGQATPLVISYHEASGDYSDCTDVAYKAAEIVLAAYTGYVDPGKMIYCIFSMVLYILDNREVGDGSTWFDTNKFIESYQQHELEGKLVVGEGCNVMVDNSG